jgi:biofilm PGA synthesis N-glycosyltransferase PgaC
MRWFLLLIFLPYLYLLLKIYFSLKKIRPFHSERVPELFISVIAACRNEEDNLPSLLFDIAGQEYNPDNFEFIIIDDNSSDSTFEVASRYTGIKHMKVLKNNGNGKKQAIKTGVRASYGRVIVTTDADCRMGEKWIGTIASLYDERHPDMIICPVKLENRQGFFGKFQELEYLSLQGITAGTAAAGNPVMCNGANLSFLKTAFDKHADNLHDELVSGDDIFLLHNLKNESWKKIIWLESPEATVTTRASETLWSFLNQRARWISKAGSYNDRYTKNLAIVTFVTILGQASLLISGFFFPRILPVFLAGLIIKSIPDFLILSDTTVRSGVKKLMRWFLPSQIIYPFYVITVSIFSLVTGKRRNR